MAFIRSTAASTLDPEHAARRCTEAARWRVWRGGRCDAAGAARSQARRAPHRRRRTDRGHRGPQERAGQACQRHRLWSARAWSARTRCAPPAFWCPAASCAGLTACGCRTAATAPPDAVTAAASAQLPDAGWQIRGRTNATPALERNIDHFTQFLTLVGLTALLVGGVGVANAVKSHIDRKRDVIATLKALGASGGRVFAIYLWQVLLVSAAGAAIGLAARRGAAVRHRGGVRRHHPAADRAGAATGRAGAGVLLWAPHRARLRALAARPRARRAGVGAVSRCGCAGTPLAARGATSSRRRWWSRRWPPSPLRCPTTARSR